MKTLLLSLPLVLAALTVSAEELKIDCSADEMTEPPWAFIVDFEKGTVIAPDEPKIGENDLTMKFEIISVSEDAIIALGVRDTNPDEVLILNRLTNPSIWVSTPVEGTEDESIWKMDCFREF